MSDTPVKYRADIDGLRAIAILLVTVFHFDLFSIGKAGFIGVDVFFVISGFLITSIIARELAGGRFSYGRFLYRRVRRLYPALLATLFLFFLAGSVLLLPDVFQELGREALLSQLYVVNFYFWRTVNYFGLHAANVPLLHMWSLAIEEQFYLFFPLVCLLIWRVRAGWLTGAVILATILSFLLGYFATPWKPWAAFYLLPTRAWELLAGGALALILQSRTVNPTLSWLLGPLGLGLVVISVWAYNPATQVPGWYALLPVSASLCLIAAGLNQTAPVTRLLSLPLLVFIGLISYPLYLVHWPVLFLLRETVVSFDLPWRLTGFLVSFVLAWVIYRCVELPIRRGQFLLRPGSFLGMVGVTSAGLVLVSLFAAQNGLPQRFSPEVSEVLAYKEDEAFAFRHCEHRLQANSTEACRLGDPSANPDLLVIGDSHANAFARSIDIWLSRAGRAAYFSFSHGCLPTGNLGPKKCEEHFNAALDFVGNTPEIETVMILSIWVQPYAGAGMLHKGKWTQSGEIEAIFADELRNSVSAVSERGAKVILVDPFFVAPAHVPKALAKNLAFGQSWPVDKPLQEHEADFERLYDAFEKTGADRISLISNFCNDGLCRSTYDNRPVFTDNNHVADAMSEVLSVEFEKAMAGLKQ